MAPLNVLTANKEDIVKYFAAAIMPTAQHMVDTVGKLGDELGELAMNSNHHGQWHQIDIESCFSQT